MRLMLSSLPTSPKRIALVLALGLGLGGCASWPQPASKALPAELQQAMKEAGLPESALGLVAFPLHARGTGPRVQADVAMQPGSTMKLVTAVVALEQLGANSRGRTDLLIADTPQGDVLPGPLYLRGGADPDLDWPALWLMLRQLREQGLREIRGGLVVDRSLFNPARPELGAPPFDEAPEFPYNVIPDALNLNGSLLQYEFSADAQALRARSSPVWHGLQVDASTVRLAPERACKDWEQGWLPPRVRQLPGGQVLLQLQGEFPANCQQRQALNLLDRQWMTAQLLRQFWRELGGEISGPDLEAATPANAELRASHQGRPLAEAMRGMMKQSDNALTRLVYLQLGSRVAAPGQATREAAAAQVQAWFAAKGLDSSGLVMDNGSGLSRSERIKPTQLAALLAVAWDGPQAPELLNSLPIAGVDGTMRRRLKGTAAEGHARLKTGTLRDVTALAGYAFDAQHKPWVLVAIVNDAAAGAKGRAVLDAAVEWVAKQ